MKHMIEIGYDTYGPLDEEQDVAIETKIQHKHELQNEVLLEGREKVPTIYITNEKIKFSIDLLDDGTIRIIHEEGACDVNLDEDGHIYLKPE